jgi:hypothetical protein
MGMPFKYGKMENIKEEKKPHPRELLPFHSQKRREALVLAASFSSLPLQGPCARCFILFSTPSRLQRRNRKREGWWKSECTHYSAIAKYTKHPNKK